MYKGRVFKYDPGDEENFYYIVLGCHRMQMCIILWQNGEIGELPSCTVGNSDDEEL